MRDDWAIVVPWIGPAGIDDLVVLLGLLTGTAYLYITWRRIDNGPEALTVVPRFSAPDDLTPGAIATIWALPRNALDLAAAMAASLVSMARKGYLAIDGGGMAGFSLRRMPDAPSAEGLPPEEATLWTALFGAEGASAIVSAEKSILWRDARKAYFIKIKDLYVSSFYSYRKKNIRVVEAIFYFFAVIGFVLDHGESTLIINASIILFIFILFGILSFSIIDLYNNINIIRNFGYGIYFFSAKRIIFLSANILVILTLMIFIFVNSGIIFVLFLLTMQSIILFFLLSFAESK